MKKTSVSFIYNFLVYLFKEITAAGFIGFLVAYKFLDVFLRKVNFVYAGDTSDITYAGYLFIARTLKQGIFPLWDPHIFGGIPLTAYAQVGLYYPFNIIFWLLPYGGGPFPYSAYQYLVTFHIFLAGWFMYLLGRTLGFRRIISVIMGMTYMFSPNILIYLGWGNQIVAFPWFPLVLACIFKALIQKKPLYSIYGGLLLGILILASPAQPAIQGLMLVVFSMISQILFTFFVNDKKNIKTIIFSLQIHLTILAIGVLIGSIELLPILEFLPRSIRFLGIDGNVIGKEKIPFHAFTTYKSSIEQLKGFLFISFANTPMAYNFYGYIPFVFSVVSVFIFFRKNFVVFFLSLLGLFSFLYSIGFIFPNIFYYIPFLNLIREPNKYLFFISISISIMTGYGIDYVYKSYLSTKYRYILKKIKNLTNILFLVGFVIAIILPYYRLETTSFVMIYIIIIGLIVLLKSESNRYLIIFSQILLLLFIYKDLSQFSPNLQTNNIFDINNYIYSQKNLNSLKPQKNEMFRVSGIENSRWPYAFNSADMTGFFDIFGYGSPLYYKLLEYRTKNGYCDKFYELMNVRYFVTYPESNQRLTDCNKKILPAFNVEGVQHIDYNTLPKNQTDTLKVYENRGAKGHFWLLSNVVTVKEKDMIFTLDKKFDIYKQVLVHKIDYDELKSFFKNDSEVPNYTAKLKYYSPNKIQYSVSTNKKSLAVISELYYPGWTVSVNGQEQKLYEVDYVLRGVIIDKGASLVEYKFEPKSMFIGLFLLFITLFISIINIIIYLIIKNKKNINIFHIVSLVILIIMLVYFISTIPGLQDVNIKRTI